MESAPARAQSRIPPFRLSKTVQPALHKGQRRWLPHFSGQSSFADAKNGAKKRVFPKYLLSPRGTRAAGHSVSTHTMLRAALKHQKPQRCRESDRVSTHTMLRAALKLQLPIPTSIVNARLDTHNAACGIETIGGERISRNVSGLDTHNAACGIETSPSSGHRASCSCLDTHNAACGIDSKTALRVLSVTQSRFRMQKAHSNLDDAAHYRRTLIINTVNTTRNVKEALINSAQPS